VTDEHVTAVMLVGTLIVVKVNASDTVPEPTPLVAHIW